MTESARLNLRPATRLFRAGVFFALLACLGASAAEIELRPFDNKSLAAIRQSHPGQSFILAFWSIHCAPCKDEMARLKTIKQQYPHLPIVLVATDPPDAKTEVQRFLTREAPGAVETWAFADAFEERVRFSVDRTWHGELPRTYFFDAEHRAIAQSGTPDPDWLSEWLKKNAALKK